MSDLSGLEFLCYIDPGSGSLLLQILISAVLGGWLFFRKQIAGAFRLLSGRRGPAAEARDQDRDEASVRPTVTVAEKSHQDDRPEP